MAIDRFDADEIEELRAADELPDHDEWNDVLNALDERNVEIYRLTQGRREIAESRDKIIRQHERSIENFERRVAWYEAQAKKAQAEADERVAKAATAAIARHQAHSENVIRDLQQRFAEALADAKEDAQEAWQSMEASDE